MLHLSCLWYPGYTSEVAASGNEVFGHFNYPFPV